MSWSKSRSSPSIAAKKKKIVRRILSGLLVVAVVAGAIHLLRPSGPPAKRFSRLLRRAGCQKPNIVLITMDTTRADHLPAYGYAQGVTPNLDRLAERGIVFEQCITSSPFTLPAHCSILTGLLPTYHGVRINGNTALADRHQSLARVLGRQGYSCGAFIGAFVLDGRWGLKQGFDIYDDRFDLDKYQKLDLGVVQRPANEVADAALAWLERQREKPFFAWIHFYDPHVPYLPPEPYLSRFRDRGLSGLYDGEIAFMDEQIGRCVDWLAQKGLGQNTLLFLVGDHGEGLGDHGELTHGYFIYEYAVHVPLIVSTPIRSLQRLRVGQQVRTIDLYATILEMAGCPPPAENQGESLLPLFFDRELPDSRPAYSESLAPNMQYGWSPLYSLRRPPLKFIDAPRPELYDVQKDPGELRDIKLKQSREMKRMQAELKQLIQTTSRGAPSPMGADLDSETLSRLASLGYIGTIPTAKATAGSDEALADPKDKLEIYAAVTSANEKMNQDRYEEAVAILEPILSQDPSVTLARLFLAIGYTHLHRQNDAKACLDQILRQDPNHIQALICMANVLSEEGKSEDVIALCQKALTVDPRNTQAYTLIGEVYMKKNDHGRALTYLQQAAAIQPKMTQIRQNLAACYIGLKRYGEAEPILLDIIRVHPRFPLAQFHLGLLHDERQRGEDARRAYEKELENYPQEFSARFNLGKLLLRSGDIPGYMREMNDLTRLHPQMPQGYLFLARGMLRLEEDPDRIEIVVKKGLELAQSDELKALGYFLLADVYARKKEPAKVEQALARARQYSDK